MTQTSQFGRIVTLVAVSQGQVFTAQPGDDVWSTTVNNTGNTPPLNFSGIVYSAPNNQLLYFADGINWCYYQTPTNSVELWLPTAGVLPVDSQNNTPKLIVTWRGRTVLSGLLLDPQNWFMSAVSDPTNFDYSPLSITPTQAIAGNNAPQGLIGDVVTSMCPYTDDVLIMFGDHTIYLFNGDPMAGGQIDLISDAIGGTFGICWCKDPYGNVYFMSNKAGVYSLVPGQAPRRISQAIEQLLLNLDTGTNNFRLIWDDRFQGFHMFVTPIEAPGPATHFFWDQRNQAWFTDQFANPNHSPLAVCTFDGNDPGDRVPLIGSWDGFCRAIDPLATTDDGFPIQSSVVIGPILTKDLDDVLLKDQQIVLGNASGQVTYAVHIGPTAELALKARPVITGILGADRNLTNNIRWAGHAIYLKLSSSNAWAMEQVRWRVAAEGKVRRRGV